MPNSQNIRALAPTRMGGPNYLHCFTFNSLADRVERVSL